MIDKNILKMASDDDEKILLAKTIDKANIAIKTHRSEFSVFMDPYKAHKFKSFISSQREIDVMLYGGYDMAERLKLGFFTEYDTPDVNDFPITTLEIKYNSQFSSSLTHRDFLGSVLGLGITREKIGDIILESSRAIVYCDEDIADYISFNLDKVKRTKVNCSVITDYMPPVAEMSEKKFTVSSLRLDAIVSHAFNISRGKAADYIKSEKVFVNWKNEISVSKPIAENDVITLRGYGRIKVLEILGTTKKDRILLNIGICK